MTSTLPESPADLPEVTDAAFDAVVLASDRPVLVDFTDLDCGHCRSMEIVAVQVAEEYAGRADVVKVVAAHSPLLTARYGVLGLPTFLLIVRGDVVARLAGLHPKSTLRRVLNAHAHRDPLT